MIYLINNLESLEEQKKHEILERMNHYGDDLVFFFFVIDVVSIYQRLDTEVVDEPLYASFLKATGFDRPYRDEVLSKMVCN